MSGAPGSPDPERPDRRTRPRVVPFVIRAAARPVALAWGAAAAALLLAGYQQVRVHRRDLQLRQLIVALDTTMKRLNSREDRLATVLDPHSRMYVLQAAANFDTTRRAGAQLFWRGDRQLWLVHVFNMPPLPAGKVYQLWYVTASGKISAGVIRVDETGQGVLMYKLPPEAQPATQAAMSVEPEGGSPQPSGPMVMSGSVEAPPR